MLFRLYQCNFQTQLVSNHFENVRFTNNNNHNNSNLAIDIPLDSSSCRLFRGRIVIWNVSFCGGTQRKTLEAGRQPTKI